MTFGDYQNEIYFRGLAGIVPSLPMVFAEWEAKAEAALPPSVWSYVAGGAGDEHTQRTNASAFERWGLVPRRFVGAKDRDLSVELFGMTLPSPVFLAPIGVIGLCAQDGHGDLATAEAAAGMAVPMVASTFRNSPRAWCGAPRRRASKPSWSRSAPWSPAGGRGARRQANFP